MNGVSRNSNYMNRLILIPLILLSITIASCSDNREKEKKTETTKSDSITEVPDQNVRPTGDLRSTENVDLDTTDKSSNQE